MELLKSLLAEGEVIAMYHTNGDYCIRNCIIDQDSDDICGALEETLHRLIESGNIDSIYEIMGAYIPTAAEWKDLQELDEYIDIDLSYILCGTLLVFHEVGK